MEKLHLLWSLIICMFVFCLQPVLANKAESTPKNSYSLYNISTLKHPKVVITDVNDTLIKSWWPTFELITNCLDRLNEPRMSLEEINASPLIHPVDLLWSKTNKNLATIEEIYKEELLTLSKHSLPPIPIDGASELLDYLKDRHIPIIVISNDERRILLKNLDKLNWTKYFHAILTKDEAPDGINKPDPRIVKYALQKAGLDKENYDLSSIWFIGDSYGDVKCAASANVVPIWVKDKATAKFNQTSEGIKIVVTENLNEIVKLLRGLKPTSDKQDL